MAKISWFLTGVTMFMIMFGFTLLAVEISEERNIMLIIMFIGIAAAVLVAYPILQIFEAFYENQVPNDKVTEIPND